MAVDVKNRPSGKATKLKVERSGNTFKGTWQIPSKATNDTNASRWGLVSVKWRLGIAGTNADPVDIEKPVQVSTKENSQTYGEFKGNWGKVWKGKPLNRTSFYPCKAGDEVGKKVEGVVLYVRGENSKGSGDWASFSYKFSLPAKPTVTLEYEEHTARLSWKVKNQKADGAAERYDTVYRVRYRVYNANTKKWSGWSNVTNWTASRSNEFSGYNDVDWFRSSKGVDFAAGHILEYTVEAYARGIRGDNPARQSAVSRTMRVRYPEPGSIKSVSVTAKNSNGRVRLDVVSPFFKDGNDYDKTSQTKTTVELQRLKNVSPDATASQVARTPESSWESVEGATNDGNVEYLYDQYPNSVSEDGTYTWYRMKSTMFGWVTYSSPKRADAAFNAQVPEPSAVDDRAYIHSIEQGDDGKSAKVVVGWKENNANTGTEVSWSTNVHAWESVKKPETFSFEWMDNQKAAPQYTGSGTVYLDGLTEGETYYVRAQRYLDGDEKTYSPYSEYATVTPVTRPESVELSAPDSVRRGDDIELSWTFSSDVPQKSWSVHSAGSGNSNFANLAGTDPKGSAIVPASAYGSLDSLDLYVSVSTGGNPTDSNIVSVAIADPPLCEAAVEERITGQPTSVEVYTDKQTSVVLCTVKSRQIVYEQPDGSGSQLDGDIVYSDASEFGEVVWEQADWNDTMLLAQLRAARPILEAEYNAAGAEFYNLSPSDEGYEDAFARFLSAQYAYEANYAAITAHVGNTFVGTLALDTGIPFVDTGLYDFHVSVKDVVSGLTSGESVCTAEVAWEHQAPDPSDAIEVVPSKEDRSVAIRLVPPTGAYATDRYDIYRKVPGGYVAAAKDVALDATIVDPFAPFSKDSGLAYRVCVRTADGDVSFYDYPYDMRLSTMRIDFGGDSVELPCNITLSNSSAKSFEARPHFGRIDKAGYWDTPVSRTAQYKADTFKTANDELLAALERLACHPGACFVRTADGHAFTANVDVSTSETYDDHAVSVDLGITKVALAEEYMIPKPREGQQ